MSFKWVTFLYFCLTPGVLDVWCWPTLCPAWSLFWIPMFTSPVMFRSFLLCFFIHFLILWKTPGRSRALVQLNMEDQWGLWAFLLCCEQDTQRPCAPWGRILHFQDVGSFPSGNACFEVHHTHVCVNQPSLTYIEHVLLWAILSYPILSYPRWLQIFKF